MPSKKKKSPVSRISVGGLALSSFHAEDHAYLSSQKPVQDSLCDHYEASYDELTYSMHTLNTSCAPQQNYTQILADFLHQRGSFAKDSPSFGSKAQKLSLWQAILVKVGLCYDGFGTPALPGLARPSNFPKVAMALPTSLRGCRNLIKKYVFLNIVDMKAGRTRVSKRKSVPFELFSR